MDEAILFKKSSQPTEIELVKCDVNLFNLEPDQRLVVKLPAQVPVHAMQKVRLQIAKFLRIDADRVLVCPAGIEFEVIGQGPVSGQKTVDASDQWPEGVPRGRGTVDTANGKSVVQRIKSKPPSLEMGVQNIG
jgi:hypothetical protein